MKIREEEIDMQRQIRFFKIAEPDIKITKGVEIYSYMIIILKLLFDYCIVYYTIVYIYYTKYIISYVCNCLKR